MNMEEELLPEESGQEEQQEEQQEKQPVGVEDLAADLGWSPKDNWRGDEADWKPADEFLRETAKINKSMRQEMKGLRDQTSRLVSTTSSMLERVRQEERQKLEAEFNDAVDMGDHVKVREVSAKLTEASQPTEDPAVSDFVSRNSSWFQVDPIATQMAIATAELHAKQGKPATEQAEAAEAMVRQRFPELFPEERKAAKPQAQTEEGTGRTARVLAPAKKGFANLPPEAKKVALDFEKKGLTREAYAEEYWKEIA